MRLQNDRTAAQRARTLAAELATLPGIDPGWAEAFDQIPRHLFVPAFYPTLDTNGESAPGLVDESTDRDEWLDAVYRDRSLVTRCAVTPGTSGLWQSTSSSTRPSLMARMLTLLDIDDTHLTSTRVLERLAPEPATTRPFSATVSVR